jgi:galactonate dehydratase
VNADDLYGGGGHDDVFTLQPKLKGAVYPVPDTPGLGIEIDEAALTRDAFRFWEAPHLRRRDGSVTNW